MSEQHPLHALSEAAVVAVVRAPDPNSALRGVEALLAGGLTAIEVTYSTPSAAQVIAELDTRYGDGILVGAGTVVNEAQAVEAADAGARFMVSPGSEESLARAMIRTGRTVLLGALTPTELMRVVAYGAQAVKIFPASVGGPSYLEALKGPFPDVPLVPTGGVNAENLPTWFDAGAVAVGAGNDLCSMADLAGGRWDKLETRARQYTAALQKWRQR